MDFKLLVGFLCLVLGCVYVRAMELPKLVVQPTTMSFAEIMEKTLKLVIEAETGPEDRGQEDLEYIEYLKEQFPRYEKKLSTIRQNFPGYEVMGSLDYFMSLKELKKKVRARFKEMYKKGHIITENAFQRRDKSKWHKVKGGTDLTRIWGADYLSKKFAEDKRAHFKVPDYLIVVSDLNDIQVGIDLLGSCVPIVNPLVSGTVYAEKIDGTPDIFPDIGYGFTDYSDPGNIIRTKDDEYYVVDTEDKSFYDNSQLTYLFSQKPCRYDWRILCPYLRHRFGVVNTIDMYQKYNYRFSVLN